MLPTRTYRKAMFSKQTALFHEPMMANHVYSQNNSPQGWLVDSAASHHMTSDLNNLSLHSDYEGQDEIIVADGTSLNITHTGSAKLNSFSSSFFLNYVLCAHSMKNNLISVLKFCKANNTSIEFFPSFFVVKDLHTGAILLRGPNNNDVYEWPKLNDSVVQPLALVSVKASISC